MRKPYLYMIQRITKILLTISFGVFSSVFFVHAASPTLSISPSGDGNNVTVNVTNADGNTPVVLFYTSALYTGTQSQNIGNTNSNGAFSGTVSTNAYGITTSAQVFALINGYQTPFVTWPYNTSATSTANTIIFSQNNPSIAQGQSLIVTVSGGTGGYYISSNSNQSVVQASISGNILSLYGSQAGTATIIICSSNSVCATQIVTTTTAILSTGYLNLNPSNISISIGQTAQVIVTGGIGPYSTFYDGANKVTASVVGTTITVSGVSLGNTSVTVCGVSGGCAPINVTVTQGTTPTSAITINIPLAVGQTLTLPLSGGSGAFYIATPISSPFNATVSSNKLYLVGTAIGNNTVTICSSATLCSTIAVAVSAESINTIPLKNTVTSSSKYIFSKPLYQGVRSEEVRKLQERLADEGYLTVTPNGYYGPATFSAVKAYQRAHNLSALGNVGPGTREELNR
jgi:hypothetical protein